MRATILHSACSVDLSKYADIIEQRWLKLGLHMKLVFGRETATFTGYNFLADTFGLRFTYVPEPQRSSAKWSCSFALPTDYSTSNFPLIALC